MNLQLHHVLSDISDISDISGVTGLKINHSCDGDRRTRAALSRQRLRLSEKVVRRLMKQEGLVVAKPRRRQYGSCLGGDQPGAGKPPRA